MWGLWGLCVYQQNNVAPPFKHMPPPSLPLEIMQLVQQAQIMTRFNLDHHLQTSSPCPPPSHRCSPHHSASLPPLLAIMSITQGKIFSSPSSTASSKKSERKWPATAPLFPKAASKPTSNPFSQATPTGAPAQGGPGYLLKVKFHFIILRVLIYLFKKFCKGL